MNIDADIEKCLAALRNRGVILYPTDTVWGLGCDATDSKAVGRIFDIKSRPDSKAMLLLVADMEMLSEYVGSIPPAAIRLLADAHRPTTVIYDRAKGIIDSSLIADDGSIGIRIPNDTFCRRLCRELGHPLVSTSANISGEPAPRNFKDIPVGILRSVDYASSLRRDEQAASSPSDIFKVKADGEIIVIRKCK